MDRIQRVLAAHDDLLLNELTRVEDRRVVAAGWVVTSRRRPQLRRFATRAAAERYFRDEVRRAQTNGMADRILNDG